MRIIKGLCPFSQVNSHAFYMHPFVSRIDFNLGVTTILAPFPLLFILKGPDLNFLKYTGILLTSGFLSGFAGLIVKSLLIQVTLPETRGTAFAAQSLLDELGKGKIRHRNETFFTVHS